MTGNILNQTDPSIGVDSSGHVLVTFTGGGGGSACPRQVDAGRTFALLPVIPSSIWGAASISLRFSWRAIACVSGTTDVHGPGEWFTYSSDGGNTFLGAVTPMDIPVTEIRSPTWYCDHE